MRIHVLREHAGGERRVAATPETVRKLTALGAQVSVEPGAGLSSFIADEAYCGAGAVLAERANALSEAHALLCVQPPEPSSLAGARPGS